ncbi:hypothetical protein BU14_0074s0042 [Porphyra umbilicalis]|uniref:Uncharacterized protein n=1 Tax=Porphyra umbilicalis TaxID=2786 RepID=A0A1X6PFH2_PORUM|nr:hypothetical protein BU14_0074s0042 [Porphyra umbilicalis]|eukprot:OSX79612.1 hypothetical protein BU14_0074s0042 [Porphyra umbilicalis]
MALSIAKPWSVLALSAPLARAPPPRGPRFEHDNPCGLYTCGSRASLVPRGFRYCGPDRWLFAVVVGVYQLCTAAPLPPSTPPPHQPPPPLPACLGLSYDVTRQASLSDGSPGGAGHGGSGRSGRTDGGGGGGGGA